MNSHVVNLAHAEILCRVDFVRLDDEPICVDPPFTVNFADEAGSREQTRYRKK